jgi:hypothetical protein
MPSLAVILLPVMSGFIMTRAVVLISGSAFILNIYTPPAFPGLSRRIEHQ